jgi:hypothetical protein
LAGFLQKPEAYGRGVGPMAEKPDPFQSSFEEAFDRYLKNISPRVGDPTYSVLRAHLLLEELLNEFIAGQVKHPDVLSDIRFSFPQRLQSQSLFSR